MAATTLTGSPAAWAKMVGVSAMSPMSTEPPVSAAMTGGPPTKFAKFTVYGAPLSASVAAKIVWNSFSWSPNVMVTPASDVVCSARAPAVDAPPRCRAVRGPTTTVVAARPRRDVTAVGGGAWTRRVHGGRIPFVGAAFEAAEWCGHRVERSNGWNRRWGGRTSQKGRSPRMVTR